MIDDKDRAILDILQRDDRTGYAEIGSRVKLAASSVYERVKRMERQGVIRAYGAVVDAREVGRGVTAFVSVATRAASAELVPRLAAFPEVEDCYSIAGADSLLLKVRTRSTQELESLLERMRATIGVERTRTTIALDTYFERRPLPLLETPSTGDGDDNDE
jgi:Lrp/AsnC family leucine-responsive transcriptional regulator